MTNRMNQLMGLMAMLAGPVALLGQGTVSGVVSDEKGKAYGEGARVLVVRVAEKPDGFEPFVSNTVTGKDGSYRIGNVLAGKYEICVATNGGDYVDGCRWGQAAGTALVVNGGSVVANVSLTRGKIFTIDIKDDDGYLERHEGKSAGGFLNMGVFTEGKEFLDAEIATLTKNARKYRVVVPVGARFRVRAISPLFDVRTENETAGGAGQGLRVLQDMDQVIEALETTKGVTLKLGGVKALEGVK